MTNPRFQKLVDEAKVALEDPNYDPLKELGKLARSIKNKKPKAIVRVFVKSDPDVNEYIRCTNIGPTLEGVKRNIYTVKGLIDRPRLKRFVKFEPYAIEDIACEVYKIELAVDVEAIKR